MATIQSERIFATAPNGARAPDSITEGDGSVWVEYGNGASSKGGSGSSTIVQYSPTGDLQHTYTIPGLADGLKYDPSTGNIWALQNQDANATITFIDPATQQVSAPLSYAPPYPYGDASTRGFDDVAFNGKSVFLSETNPANPGDPVIVKLTNGTAPIGPLETTSILRLGDTGKNLVTGETNQALPVTDPDSLKTLPDGSLILTGEDDKAFTIVQNPGTTQQTASFVTLPGSSASPDDAIIPTATSGTFYVSNQGNNNVIAAKVTGLDKNDIYTSVGTSVDQVDPRTGVVTPLITGLNAAHGLLFAPDASPVTPTTIADVLKNLPTDFQHALVTDFASLVGKLESAAASGTLPTDSASMGAYGSLLALAQGHVSMLPTGQG